MRRRSWANARRQARYRAIEAENARRMPVIVGAAFPVRTSTDPERTNPDPASATQIAIAAGDALRAAVA